MTELKGLRNGLHAVIEGHRSSSSMMLGRPSTAASASASGGEVKPEARTRLCRCVRTAIVGRHDLDIQGVVACIDVDDAHVRELHVPLVVAWKFVLPRPLLDLERIAVRPAIAVDAISVSFLQDSWYSLFRSFSRTMR